MRVRVSTIAVLSGLAIAGSAWAGPCQAPAPAVGVEVHGPVLHVLDGRRLCVAQSATPDQWVELTLADSGLTHAAASSPRPRGALMAAAFGQNVVCKVIGREGGAALAACTVDGQPVDRLADHAHARQDGQLWR